MPIGKVRRVYGLLGVKPKGTWPTYEILSEKQYLCCGQEPHGVTC